ncbi:MAG: 1-phosphofructokinase family hexose kinase [Chloroflexi bacterium]|nr:1-phosphofructokinase family hexose kinase [Chloroflexota bacterium]
MKILCVNLNAAIDKTIVIENFSLDAIHRPRAVLAQGGGKGANVARVVTVLGGAPIVTGFVGGWAGRFIETQLRREQIATAFVRVPGESRTCLSILDPARRTLTEIYERGEPIPRAALRELRVQYRARLSRCAMVTLSGSLPANVPATFYADLIALARKNAIPVLLDSSGDALRLGLAARPLLIKPNRAELRALVQRELATLDAVADAACQIARAYQTIVVASLGARGAIAAQDDHIWRATIPKIQTVSAVGSGDAMLAGLAISFTRGAPLENALRLGTAAGAANARTLGAGRLKKIDLRRLMNQIKIEKIA